MAKSIIIYGRPDWGMADHAQKLRQHFGLKHVVIDFDGKFHEEENFLYIAYCYLPGCTPATMRVMSYAAAAAEYNGSIPLTDWQSGPPPMVGEWNASAYRMESTRRWWNGNSWSMNYVQQTCEEQKVLLMKLRITRGDLVEGIEWRGLSSEPIKVTE